METKTRKPKKNTDHFHQFIVIGLVFAIIGIAGLYFYIPYREMLLVKQLDESTSRNIALQKEALAQLLVVDYMEQQAAIIAYTGFGKILIDGNEKGFLSYLAEAYPSIVYTKTQNSKDVRMAMNIIKESYGFNKIPHESLGASGAIWKKIDDNKISVTVPYANNTEIVPQTFYFMKTNGVWYFDFLN